MPAFRAVVAGLSIPWFQKSPISAANRPDSSCSDTCLLAPEHPRSNSSAETPFVPHTGWVSVSCCGKCGPKEHDRMTLFGYIRTSRRLQECVAGRDTFIQEPPLRESRVQRDDVCRDIGVSEAPSTNRRQSWHRLDKRLSRDDTLARSASTGGGWTPSSASSPAGPGVKIRSLDETEGWTRFPELAAARCRRNALGAAIPYCLASAAGEAHEGRRSVEAEDSAAP